MRAIPHNHERIIQFSRAFARVLLVGLFASAVATAQPRYQFDSWTTENGLPQNSINDILQTRDGYLWLATHGGLVRFDGARFVVFDRSIEGIRSQRIKALCEDRKGALWAGTEEGMLVRYRDGKFTTYAPEDRLPSEEVFRIEEDDEGNLWITGRGVVIKFDGERFVNYLRGDFALGGSGYPGANRVSWSQDSAGLHCLVKGRVQSYSFQSDLPNAQILRVGADLYGNLWIQTRGAGVVKLTNGQSKLYTMREGLPSNDIEGIFLEDRKGNLWLAHYKGSLYRIRDSKCELARTFPINSLSTLYEDREGSIWIGTPTGLHRMRELTITLYTERQGLSSNWAYSIFQDRGGAIWIGTWGGGLNKYENGRFIRYRMPEGLPSDLVTCIYEDDSRRLWVGANEWVSYFNDGRFKIYEDQHGFLKHDIWAIHQDRAGNLWFGTDEGLVKLKDGSFTKYTTKDGLPYNVIRSLLEDRAGTLWIGTDQGLTRLKDGVFTAYTERVGFIGNQVRAIYEDSDGVLWIGTYDGGLYRFKDERLTRYTTKEGLHDNGVFQILEDAVGNLWMGCNRGIYRVSRRELNNFAEGRAQSITSVVYSTKDGLATLECNGGRQPSGWKMADGKLWFPTMGGVAVIDPKAIQSNTQQPPVIIEEFRLGAQAIDFRDGVRIPRNQNSFEIRYTAPSFIKPEYVKFKYKLEGLDIDWVDAGARRVVNYNYVPPGVYTFTVIAANSDGVWNQTGRSIHLEVVPHWWEIRWAQVLMGIAVLLVFAASGFFVHQRGAAQLKKEKAMQEDFSKQLIDSQENERERVARELHDGLSQDLANIKSRAQLVLIEPDNPSMLREQLDSIVAEATQAIDETKEIAYNLRPYQLDRLGLTRSIDEMVKKISDSRKHKLTFQARIDDIDGIFPKDAELNIYRIIQESVNNLVKHSEATEAEVIIKNNLSGVEITVKDNGQGFNIKSRESNEPVKRGFGLVSIAERTRILGGKLTVQSGKGEGTTITVKLEFEDTPL